MSVLETPIEVPVDGVFVQGDLAVPPGAAAIVLFAHGSGSSRNSPRNRQVARRLSDDGIATLLLDLLTTDEEADELSGGRTRFDIDLLAGRLTAATRWLESEKEVSLLPVGYFGASTGAAAALVAVAHLGDQIGAVVSRGGRPDLAIEVLPEVGAPTLLIVGGRDQQVLEMNRRAAESLPGDHRIEIVEGAGHLFEEPGALEQVSDLASGWFRKYLLDR